MKQRQATVQILEKGNLSFHSSFTMMQPVSRSQISPIVRCSTWMPVSTRSAALLAASAFPAIRWTRSPRPESCTALAKAAICCCACCSGAPQYSAELGKPIQTASCGAHSAGIRNGMSLFPAAALVTDGAEFVAIVPIGPCIRHREHASDAIIELQIGHDT